MTIDHAGATRSKYRRRRSRPKYIRKAVRSRGITKLFHFTRLTNLESILTHGLLSPMSLDRRSLHYTPTDAERFDSHPDANCLSISFPNHKMFYLKRQQQEPKWGWCVFEFDASILWRLPSGFYPLNAANGRMSAMNLRDRMHVAAFHELFSATDPETAEPRAANLKKRYPTHVQAEVLVFGDIKPRFILRVHVPRPEIIQELRTDKRFCGVEFVLAPLDDEGKANGYNVFSPRDLYLSVHGGIDG